jgi:hypothetical protein
MIRILATSQNVERQTLGRVQQGQANKCKICHVTCLAIQPPNLALGELEEASPACLTL